MIADPTKSFAKEVKQEAEDASLATAPALPGFSGNMANCTINVNISYGKT